MSYTTDVTELTDVFWFTYAASFVRPLLGFCAAVVGLTVSLQIQEIEKQLEKTARHECVVDKNRKFYIDASLSVVDKNGQSFASRLGVEQTFIGSKNHCVKICADGKLRYSDGGDIDLKDLKKDEVFNPISNTTWFPRNIFEGTPVKSTQKQVYVSKFWSDTESQDKAPQDQLDAKPILKPTL